jgi:hypothetical protein
MYKKLAVIILCLGLVAAAGCATNNQTGPDNLEGQKSVTIMNDFLSLTQNDISVEEVANFIKNNIAEVSQEDASKMVDAFEKIQKNSYQQYEELFFNDNIQNKVNNEYESIKTQADIKDAELRDLLTKTKNSGYKVETAEGTYFPVIDYSFYKDFSSYVTSDMKDYIDIMAVESDKVPAKDAALVIGWDEVIERALNQEEFINKHKDSIRISEVEQLYNKYLTFTLYGLNNTPLFQYGTKTMNPKAKEDYSKAVADTGNSDYLKTLSEYMDLVKDNNYQLTSEVENFRDNATKK